MAVQRDLARFAGIVPDGDGFAHAGFRERPVPHTHLFGRPVPVLQFQPVRIGPEALDALQANGTFRNIAPSDADWLVASSKTASAIRPVLHALPATPAGVAEGPKNFFDFLRDKRAGVAYGALPKK